MIGINALFYIALMKNIFLPNRPFKKQPTDAVRFPHFAFISEPAISIHIDIPVPIPTSIRLLKNKPKKAVLIVFSHNNSMAHCDYHVNHIVTLRGT